MRMCAFFSLFLYQSQHSKTPYTVHEYAIRKHTYSSHCAVCLCTYTFTLYVHKMLYSLHSTQYTQHMLRTHIHIMFAPSNRVLCISSIHTSLLWWENHVKKEWCHFCKHSFNIQHTLDDQKKNDGEIKIK